MLFFDCSKYDTSLNHCTAKEFAEYLEKISINSSTPISDEYGDRSTLNKNYNGTTPHEVQKNHILSWFKDETNAERLAKNVFCNLGDPAMILWIAESVDVDNKLVKKAATDAGGKYMDIEFGKTTGKSGSGLSRHQAKIIREKLTWKLILESIKDIDIL